MSLDKSFSGWTRAEMGKAYNVDYRLINNWLEENGISHSRKLSPKEILAFIKTYGIPNDDLMIEYLSYLNKIEKYGLR